MRSFSGRELETVMTDTTKCASYDYSQAGHFWLTSGLSNKFVPMMVEAYIMVDGQKGGKDAELTITFGKDFMPRKSPASQSVKKALEGHLQDTQVRNSTSKVKKQLGYGPQMAYLIAEYGVMPGVATERATINDDHALVYTPSTNPHAPIQFETIRVHCSPDDYCRKVSRFQVYMRISCQAPGLGKHAIVGATMADVRKRLRVATFDQKLKFLAQMKFVVSKLKSANVKHECKKEIYSLLQASERKTVPKGPTSPSGVISGYLDGMHSGPDPALDSVPVGSFKF
eukprot:GHVN01027122.1.p1 GENE.GHVN01027122.1~~GHVN01027122.1.p1  ORF type:complete len:284 (+),score=15.82 GHVN01027122.1:413-1264(+)